MTIWLPFTEFPQFHSVFQQDFASEYFLPRENYCYLQHKTSQYIIQSLNDDEKHILGLKTSKQTNKQNHNTKTTYAKKTLRYWFLEMPLLDLSSS